MAGVRGLAGVCRSIEEQLPLLTRMITAFGAEDTDAFHVWLRLIGGRSSGISTLLRYILALSSALEGFEELSR